MSLVSPLSSHRGIYINCHTGDIDEEPDEITNIWASFLQEPEHDEDNQKEQFLFVPENPENLDAAVFKGIRPSISNAADLNRSPINRLSKTFSTQDKMIQVQNGNYIANCLKGEQDLNKGAQEYNTRLLEHLYSNFRKNPDGTIEAYNKDFLRRQKQVFGFLMKQFGSALLSGKSLTAISLPVIIFRDASALEQEAGYYTKAPHFLEKAGTITDITEQFKLTFTHFLASLHLALGVAKPFNPILGETFQGIIAGCPIYLEQTVHHPPTSAMYMEGKNFLTHSVTEVCVNVNVSLFKMHRVGHQKVYFKNTNTTVKAQMPTLRAHGGPLGKKTMDYGGKMYVFDIAHRLYAEIIFDYEEPSIFKKSRVSQQDHFVGSMWRINDKFADILSQLPKKSHELDDIKFKEKEHGVELIGKIEGFWLEYLKIGEKTYWRMNEYEAYKLQYFDNPLPSDSNFRMDVLHMRERDETKAQQVKDRIEEAQRKDKRLRDKHKKNQK